jgi:predicted small secreted protein
MNRHLGLPFIALLACMTFSAGNAAAGTAEDLQAVFRDYHKAELANDLDEMLKLSVKSRRDTLAKASAAEREAAMAYAAKSTPKTYKVTGSIIETNGRDATLFLIAGATDKGKTEMPYGSVVFEKEGDTWKIAAAGWARVQSPSAERAVNPAGAEPGAPVAQPKLARIRSEAAAAKPAAPIRQQSNSPCVYKSVMTDEDIARCR